MHTVFLENEDGPGERRGDGWDKDGIPTVLELLDDERQYEPIFHLDQGGLSDILASHARHLPGQVTERRVARNFMEEIFLHPIADRHASPGPNGKPDQETYRQHDQK